jgi:hypothetical protein
MSFNHSPYNPDGFQMVRFSGGLLGMALFVRMDSGWRLQVFEPAIGAYGSFSQAPTPDPVAIGDHQYGFMIGHSNGGPGGPYQTDNYLIAEVAGHYRQILSAYNCERTRSDAGQSNWTCIYKAVAGEKGKFRDIVIVCKGEYFAEDQASQDPNALPSALKGKAKGVRRGKFTITRLFIWSEARGYRERLPAKVSMRGY